MRLERAKGRGRRKKATFVKYYVPGADMGFVIPILQMEK